MQGLQQKIRHGQSAQEPPKGPHRREAIPVSPLLGVVRSKAQPERPRQRCTQRVSLHLQVLHATV